MKKLSILLLVMVALLFVGMYNAPTAQAVETDVSFDVTVVKGNDITELPSLIGQFGKGVSFNGGGLVTEGYEFAYHILNGEIIRTQSHNVLVSGSTNLIVVVQDPEAPVTVYIDTNGELLGANTSATEPLSAPSKPHFDFSGYVEIEDSNVMVATYTRNNDAPAVNVTVNFGTVVGNENIEYNDVVTVQPNSGLGDFRYWADEDGQVVSRNEHYTFSVLKDITLTAVFDKEENSSPVVYLSNVTGITPNAKSFLGYIEGDFVEYGVLASNKEEVLTLDTLGVTVIPSQALNPETNEFLRSIPETEDLKSFRAYAKLADGGVVYSENNFLMKEELQGITYLEKFDDPAFSSTSNTYSSTGGYTDTNGFIWTYAGRNDDNVRIDGNGIILGETSDKSFIQVIATGGISEFSFDAKRVNTGTNPRTYKLLVNDVLVGSWSLNTGSTETQHFSIQDMNVLGNVTIKLISEGARATAIDNISWKSYSAAEIDSKLYEIILNNEGEISKQSIIKGSNLDLSNLPQKEGYRFMGWFDETDNLVDDSTPITKHLTLTAKFEIGHYTLTFDSNGGTSVAPITGDYATDIVAPASPTKEGYTFAGWSPALPETMPAGNQTYTATWTANDYTITFDVDGGSVFEPLKQAYASELVLPVPTKDGFNFVGWFTDVDKTIPFEATTMPLGNTTLYALWQDASLTSIVTFEVNGGSEIASVVVSNGETVSEPIPPTKSGHTFVGWFSDVALEIEYSFDTPVNTDITLYAKWNSNKVVQTANLNYVGTTISASQVGLPSNIFTVSMAKNSASTGPQSYSDALRLYYDTSGNGGSVTFTIDSDYIIESFKIVTVTDRRADIRITTDGAEFSLLTGYGSPYLIQNLNANSMTLQNANTSSLQLRIVSIEITYRLK